jgi:uncharacterized protein (TIGR03083 family)
MLAMAREERQDFLTFLKTLSPEQWDAPTLCAGWRVRDVVGHVVSYDKLTFGDLATRLVHGRFSLGRTNDLGVADCATRDPDELLAVFERHLQPRGLTAGLGGMIAFLDCLIHQQDVRRPLNLPRDIPAERLCRALSVMRLAPPIGALWRTRGLRLVATDLDWSIGSGPEVRGPGEALLLAAAGRRAAAGDLTGPGQAVLAARGAG